MSITIGVLCGAVAVLVLLNIYQFLIQRAALRIAEILYVMAGNVRAKAQEVRQGRREGYLSDRLLHWIVSPFPTEAKPIMVKDIKTFLRDATQWSQLFLLMALIVVYLYNIRVLPLDHFTLPTLALRTAVSFVNLGLAGFVLSAVAIRFAFPSVSLEGKAFWIIQTSPLSFRPYLWSKFLLNLFPLLLLGTLLVLLSNLLLRVQAFMMTLSLVTIFLLTFGITAITVGMGALYPKFDHDHVAEISTSFGGAACMILCMSFVGATVLIEAWPVYLLSTAGLRPGSVGPVGMGSMALSFAVLLTMTIAAVLIPMKLGLKGLQA